MAPAVVIDNSPDFDMDFTPPPSAKRNTTTKRTLLLAPPSVASDQSALAQVAESHDRAHTDIQMLDRLALGLVSLPAATYDVVILLTDVDRTKSGSSRLLDRQVMERIVASMAPGACLKSQDGEFGTQENAERTEAILAGLTSGAGAGMIKPDNASSAQTVKLSFGRKKKADAAAVPANDIEAANTSKRKVADTDIDMANGGAANAGPTQVSPAGVGFINSQDDLNYEYDEEDEFPDDEALANADKIDPDTLLTEEDRQKPLNIRKCR